MQAVRGILSWKTNTLDTDHTPNKAGEAWRHLYHSEWRSDQVFSPAHPTEAAFRGFKGGYKVRVKRQEQVLAELEFQLEDDKTFDCISDPILETIDCQER